MTYLFTGEQGNLNKFSLLYIFIRILTEKYDFKEKIISIFCQFDSLVWPAIANQKIYRLSILSN